ncbi:YtxH domain-containing protein [Virgibacillus xinjiangensis]|uniref:YtxH domain-containing protein n=1 Tax=Virgibacillus xinjiangensis TaxID=393090 RepID=A0ABV7CY14_9BACI
MGKRRLLTGILTGAAVGGIVTLFDKQTREYTTEKLHTVKENSSYWAQHPSEAVHNVRTALDKFSESFPDNASNVLSALESAERQLEKVSGNRNGEVKQLEELDQ